MKKRMLCLLLVINMVALGGCHKAEPEIENIPTNPEEGYTETILAETPEDEVVNAPIPENNVKENSGEIPADHDIYEYYDENGNIQSFTAPCGVFVIGAHNAYEELEELAKNAFKVTQSALLTEEISYFVEFIRYCPNLETIVFSPNLKEIHYGYNESSIKYITIPSSVARLNKLSFPGCQNLETVTFEKGSLSECNGFSVAAFNHCPNLKDVYFYTDLPEESYYRPLDVLYLNEEIVFHVLSGSVLEKFIKEAGLNYEIIEE